MSPLSNFLIFFIILLYVVLAMAQEEDNPNPKCPPFYCGALGRIGFPFINETNSDCGFYRVADCKEDVQRIKFGENWPWFYVTAISQDNTVTLRENKVFAKPLNNCTVTNLSLPILSFVSVEPIQEHLLSCSGNRMPANFTPDCKEPDYSIGYQNGSTDDVFQRLNPNCSPIQLLVNKTRQGVHFFNLYTGWFRIQVNVTSDCRECFRKGGQCKDYHRKFQCRNVTQGDGKLLLNIVRGLGFGIGALTVLVVVLFIIRRCKKRKHISPIFSSRQISSDPSSTSELEAGSVYFGVPIFSYSELARATNNFNQDKELGDGGFGTVYYAKLQDGREVAVKRFYENNYRRVEQFMNEIEILTRLRHKNLVSLYGCTSRHSQQGLLLVYEFVSNGTVADHLRGGRAKSGSLSWPIRLNIAIETATALAYLHASDIIHRDVKTNNILLDERFSVKVADFGLSRLFPTDVTHVSTAPQGSPGYVDPEYHQCYQLTDKSDVYSFGVVLIELISSMPAVDMNRHRDEINLANLAINRIQNSAIDELIDPCLGYQTDEEVKRMATSVAELAFLCLQQNKEMRPPMDVVLEELKRVESGEFSLENPTEEHNDNEVFKSMRPPAPPASSPDCDEAALLKNIKLSPISVTAKWVSSDTTSSASC